jgi:hypothetical protein
MKFIGGNHEIIWVENKKIEYLTKSNFDMKGLLLIDSLMVGLINECKYLAVHPLGA